MTVRWADCRKTPVDTSPLGPSNPTFPLSRAVLAHEARQAESSEIPDPLRSTGPKDGMGQTRWAQPAATERAAGALPC